MQPVNAAKNPYNKALGYENETGMLLNALINGKSRLWGMLFFKKKCNFIDF